MAGSIVAGGCRRTTGGRSRRRAARREGKRSAGGRPAAGRGVSLNVPDASRSSRPPDVRSERRSQGERPRSPRMITRREVLRRGIAGLGVLACGAPARRCSAERPVKPFGDAIVIAGGPRERGRRYGQAVPGRDRRVPRPRDLSGLRGLAGREGGAPPLRRRVLPGDPRRVPDHRGRAGGHGRGDRPAARGARPDHAARGAVSPGRAAAGVALHGGRGRAAGGPGTDLRRADVGLDGVGRGDVVGPRVAPRRRAEPAGLCVPRPVGRGGAELRGAGAVLDERRARQAESGAARRAARVRAPGPPAVPADARRGDRGGEAGPPRRLVHVRDGRRLRPPAERRGLAPRASRARRRPAASCVSGSARAG